MGGLLVKDALCFNAVLLAILESPVVGLSSQKDGVNSAAERAHAVIDVLRPAIQPFHIAIWPGDVAICAGGDIDDDFSTFLHEIDLNITLKSEQQMAISPPRRGN